MKRLGHLAFALALVTTACAGSASESASNEGGGIAALDERDAGADARSAAGKSKADAKTKAAGAKSRAGRQAGTSRSSGDATSSAASNAGSGTSASEARAATPIPDGTYSYDTEGHTTVSGNKRDMSETTTLVAHAPRDQGQIQIRDLRDQDGNGTVIETSLLYRDEGVFITRVKITATFPGGLTDVRELKPRRPELIAPTAARPGSSTSFVMEGSGTKAAVSIEALRFDALTVGGSSVNALKMDTRIVFSGALEGERNSTTWFWPKHVLALKERVRTDVTNGPMRIQSDYHAALTSLP